MGNQRETVLMLKTDKADWPSPRVASKITKKAPRFSPALANATTAATSPARQTEVLIRSPIRSIAQPAGKQNSAPKRLAQRLICA